jgi:hypothetical protein
MGANSRGRRKAKQARQRAQDQRRRLREQAGSDQPSSESFSGQPSQRELGQLMVASAIQAQHEQDDDEFRRLVLLLAEGPGGPSGQSVVDHVIVDYLQGGVSHAWMRGWQPADLTRIAERRLGARPARLAVDAVAAEMRRYAAATVDERWRAQLDALDAAVWWQRDDQYVGAWGDREGLGREEAVECALQVLHLLDTLPVIPRLCPLPGAARPDRPHPHASGQDPDKRVLDRVRALLAKAESTEFAEEAEALTAKAQELMARYSIDAALLAARTGTRDEPLGRRVGVDRPYEAAKALLLQAVADANRCRVVWSQELGFATVLGYPGDLDAVELLYTSLLVQATTAVVHAGPRRDHYGQSRTRSFRQSFLSAYAIRIGERLRAATADVDKDAISESQDLLPVLAARDHAVKDAVDAIFPGVVGKRVAINDAEGWASGTAAADLASLDIRREVTGTDA